MTDYVAQPALRTTLDAVRSILQNGAVERIDIAVAYITSGGARDFISVARAALGDAWDAIEKRWITSFDYCRTQPVALRYVSSMPNSIVRIYDADVCLSGGCAPRTPFHPKAFLIRTETEDFALAGSGNMSKSGLSLGVEAGLVLSANRENPLDATCATSIAGLRAWYDHAWSNSAPLTLPLLERYRSIFEKVENIKNPTPTEDDLATTDSGRKSLTTKDLQKLRVCDNFWIECGKITKNRGPNLPGNQLMMKRLSRVFFGFAPTNVPKNSHIGDVELNFAGAEVGVFSLTYSDNKMDKLVLPVPGFIAPAAYDNEYLLFKRWQPGSFELSIGNNSLRNQWRKKSLAIDAAYKMTSGREWGVF